MKSTIYELMCKDKIICDIDTNTGEVNIFEDLPFNIELNDKNKSIPTLVHNLSSFQDWCASRTLMMSQKHSKLICNALAISQDNSAENKALISLSYRCCTLNDNYWVREKGDNIKYDDVSLFKNTSRNILTPISLKGQSPSIFIKKLKNWSDIGVDGTLAKSWVRENNEYYLYKESDNVEGEILASKVLKELNIPSVEYYRANEDDLEISKCKSFTNENFGFIPYRYFAKKNGIDSINLIKQNYLSDYANLVVCTYLIGNEDLHDKNWGFITDEYGKIKGLSPMFDFDGCFLNYENSKNNLFLPECKFISENGTEYITNEFTIDESYEAKGPTIEEAAKKYIKDSTINLDNFNIDILPNKYKESFFNKINVLKNELNKNINNDNIIDYFDI